MLFFGESQAFVLF